ncbi:MAG: hypothetical protein Q8P20_10355 [bacterium]|nr:hypothetical protein [bacterium]
MIKTITRAIIIYAGIAIAAVSFAMAMNYINEEKWEYERDREVLNEFIDSGVFKYAEFSTAELQELDTLTPAKANLCLYTSEQSALAEKNKTDSPCLFWNEMNSAQFDFHAKTVKARVLASDPVADAIDNVENGFMQVFDKVISEEYYMRTFQDNYNLIMPSLFTALEEVLRGELN